MKSEIKTRSRRRRTEQKRNRSILREDSPTYHVNGSLPRESHLVQDESTKDFAKAREQVFNRIKLAIEPQIIFSASGAVVAQGDSQPMLRLLPSNSVSLILTDPPYHATKKENIYGDTAFSEDEHYIQWMGEYPQRRLAKVGTGGAS
jgi:hypothetical protein